MCAILFDFAAAFDSIDHAYLMSSMNLFNMLNMMCSMLKTLITGRTAQIVDDQSELSRPFEIGRGVPQGDLHSPLTFILGMAPLLIELETALNPGHNSQETCIEAFANDLSVITNFTTEKVMDIKNIMTNFGKVTGLLLNKKKDHSPADRQ